MLHAPQIKLACVWCVYGCVGASESTLKIIDGYKLKGLSYTNIILHVPTVLGTHFGTNHFQPLNNFLN